MENLDITHLFGSGLQIQVTTESEFYTIAGMLAKAGLPLYGCEPHESYTQDYIFSDGHDNFIYLLPQQHPTAGYIQMANKPIFSAVAGAAFLTMNFKVS